MAKNEVILTEPPALPADMSAFFEQEANVTVRGAVNSLSPGGKKWTVTLNGNKTVIMKTNKDGDEEPQTFMRVFVLAAARERARAYYATGYDPEKPGAPDCWSNDGVKPDDSVLHKQHKTCTGCEMAAKGSKITDSGKGVRACGENRKLVVIPARNLESPPLRLKLSITSDFDGKNPEREATGWFSWSGYMKKLLAMMPKAAHTARIVTVMKFDPTTDYPKILFKFDRWAEPAELVTLTKRLREEKEEINSLLLDSFTPAKPADDDDDDDDAETAPAGKPRAPAGGSSATDDDDDVPAKQAEEAAAKARAAKAKAAADAEAAAKAAKARAAADAEAAANAAKAAKAKAAADDDDDDAPAKPATIAPKSAVADILKDWDD